MTRQKESTRPAAPPSLNKKPYTSTYGFKRADPRCNANTALASIGKVSLWVWDKSWPEKYSYDLTGFSGNGVASAQIAVVKTSGVFTNGKDGIFVQENSGEPIYLCNKGGDYPVDSLENMALGAAVSISMVGRLLKANNVRGLPRATIYLHPQVDSPQERSLEFNNAFYLNSTLYILPHTPDILKRDFGDIPLWAQLAVVAHEYGHLVLDTVVKRGKHPHIIHRTEGLPVDEAIADLTAFYAFSGDTSSLGKLRFGDAIHNRNVASCACDDGTFKVLSEKFLSRYFSGFGLLGPAPSPKDSHALGAIIAYGFEQILGKIRSPAPGWAEKYGMLLAWGEQLTALDADSLRGEPLLEATVLVGIRTIKEHYGALLPGNCQDLKSTFPVFFPRWLKEFPECKIPLV